jgi:XTP/dITP diphosphohydrolase
MSTKARHAHDATRRAVRLVLASNNAKKLAELRALLAGLPVTLVAQGELAVAEAAEPFQTFVENALVKARHAAAATGCAALADDSGLCVDALGGEPGVASAHYAAAVAPAADREQTRARQDAANNALLLERMHARADRRARFVSTLVAIRHADDPEPLIAQGRWELELLHAPRGSGGFGYDPLVLVPTHSCSVSELDAATKNTISHRALAARQMVVLLREVWRLG